MTALIAEIGPGDEIIMPSYTFVSTANAFVSLRPTPVFVDIREDTLNMDEKLVEQAINDKTKAVVAVHYAGVGCEPVFLKNLCNKYDILFVEDAAQGIEPTFDDQPIGSFEIYPNWLSWKHIKNLFRVKEDVCLSTTKNLKRELK